MTNMDQTLVGEMLLRVRKNHPELTLSQVYDRFFSGDSDRSGENDGLLPSSNNGREATLPDPSTNGRG